VENQKPFKIKPWMWGLIVIALLLIVFNIDPVGHALNSVFGKGADRWGINIIIIGAIIFTFLKKK